MKFSKKQIGEYLQKELENGYSIERISNWAYDLLYFTAREKQILEISNVLRDLSVMEAGPEFEYSEKELRLLAEKLINNEEDPIKQINGMKSKG